MSEEGVFNNNILIMKMNLENNELLQIGHCIIDEVGSTYHHIPFWFKHIKDQEYELLYEDQLPSDVKEMYNQNKKEEDGK